MDYYSGGETWKGWKVWGRWTEGPISRIVRENLNVLWRAYKEVVSETKLYAADGMEIDYRLAGIFDKKDRAPRALIVYDESNSDPRVKIYMRPPDGTEPNVFESLVKTTFADEENDRRQKKQGRASSSTELPKTPHEVEIRTRQYRHSFRSMKELNDDYPPILPGNLRSRSEDHEEERGTGREEGKRERRKEQRREGQEQRRRQGQERNTGRWRERQRYMEQGDR